MTVIRGDCVEVMAGMPDASVDAVVTDPPYMLGFMGKAWDTLSPGDVQHGHDRWASQALRVLRPGGHLLAFGGTRTYHRLACATEDAGFEIRDCIVFMYGSGFPKSRNLDGDWEGWGTALKPAHEPIVVARKPLSGTVAATVLEHGTGALNVDGCRVGTKRMGGYEVSPGGMLQPSRQRESGYRPDWKRDDQSFVAGEAAGRWPANVVLSHHEACTRVGTRRVRGAGWSDNDAAANTTGRAIGQFEKAHTGRHYADPDGLETVEAWDCHPECPIGQLGEPARFFFSAKSSSAERNAGLDGFEERASVALNTQNGYLSDPRMDRQQERRPQANVHPTVKPIDLMRWLVRLVTPPGGTILDPFAGSGTTGIAAVLERFDFIGIEREPEYADIAEARIRWWEQHPEGVELVKALEADRERKALHEQGQDALF